jgi:hypothetical protein
MSITRKIGLGLLTVLAAVMVASAPASAQQPKPNSLFIMGDDIGLDAAEHLPPRPDGRRNP